MSDKTRANLIEAIQQWDYRLTADGRWDELLAALTAHENAARAEAVLEYASQKDALVGGPHEGAHRANAVAYVKAQGWLTQEPQKAPTTCADCPRCGDHVRTSDLRQWQVCEQTHMEPAEYEDGCTRCWREEDER